MIAAHHRKHPAGIREFALLNLFHPCSKDTDRYVVLRFAGGGAGMAADALAIVYNKTVFHANGRKFVLSLRA
jgi:hypothetical protein